MDEQWLLDLHLLQVVVRDAEQSLRIMDMGADIAVNLDEFFEKLVKKQRRSLARLLSAYAERDAAAVFRVADICHIDLAKDFPDIIIRSCDKMPFFGLVVETATSADGARVTLWAAILAEAGLRSRVVRKALLERSPADNFRPLEVATPVSARWCATGFMTRNLFTQSVSIAVNSSASEQMSTLSTLREMPAPGRYRHLRIVCWLTMSAVVAVLAALAASGASMLSRTGALLVATVLMYVVGARYLAIRFIYSYVLYWPSVGDVARDVPSSERSMFLLRHFVVPRFLGSFVPSEMRNALTKIRHHHMDYYYRRMHIEHDDEAG